MVSLSIALLGISTTEVSNVVSIVSYVGNTEDVQILLFHFAPLVNGYTRHRYLDVAVVVVVNDFESREQSEPSTRATNLPSPHSFQCVHFPVKA
jgi:hypothetical protein